MKSGARALLVVLRFVPVLLCTACEDEPPPDSSFYDERINPIMRVGCVQQTTGCHLASADGVAVGNLDLSSFDALMRREDVLPPYGPYGVGLLLLKGGQQIDVQVETFDPPDPTKPDERFVRIRTDVRHNAGPGIALDSNGYAALRAWIQSGYTRYGTPRENPSTSLGSCRNGVGVAPDFDAGANPTDSASFDRFALNVQPVLRERCAGGNCHGNPNADLYISCGDSTEEMRWNYYVSLEHLTNPLSLSELLRRPLAKTRGGTFHEGGDVFMSTDEAGYQAIREWGEDIVERRPELLVPPAVDDGLRFFANRVQPVLVRKGCMFLNCHSPAMFHELRLRGGSQGSFSTIATRRNYEMSRLLLALESPNPNDSRLIAKNLYVAPEVPNAEGMAHRGGSLFEDLGMNGELNRATLDDCDTVDAEEGDLNEIPAYCVLAKWHEIERAAAIDRGEILDDTEVVRSLVWVSRPVGVGSVRDFDDFRGNADLLSAPVTVAADGSITLGASSSLLGDCGISSGADVRTPAVSWDAEKIAFAARSSAAQPLRLYWMDSDGSNCEPIPGIAASSTMENGILVHDFDPAFAPDGRIAFASTRGNLGGGYSYSGPTRTPAALQPNANMYVFTPGSGDIRQLTFLLNQEVSPNFMLDGRLVLTTEKREPGFHQLSGRRQNLDGGDYHPLFAQRRSVGFESATEIVELANRNLAVVAANMDAVDGGGTIAIVNRSIGPDQDDRPGNDRFYVHSLRFPAPGAFGNLTGVYRSPAALPTGRVVVSCDQSATSLTAGPFDYALCELDPRNGAVRVIGGESGRANVESVAVYGRAVHPVFLSRTDEVNGFSQIDRDATDAVVHILDFPMFATLLFSNTREGRPIDSRIGGFDVLEALPPPSSATSFSGLSDVVEDDYGSVYAHYESLGSVSLNGDGSAKIRVPGGTPLLYRVTDGDGEPLMFGPDDQFQGEVIQREQVQYLPGERTRQAMPRRLFNGICAGCHGSISGRELDIAVDIDVLTRASETAARDESPTDLTR